MGHRIQHCEKSLFAQAQTTENKKAAICVLDGFDGGLRLVQFFSNGDDPMGIPDQHTLAACLHQPLPLPL